VKKFRIIFQRVWTNNDDFLQRAAKLTLQPVVHATAYPSVCPRLYVTLRYCIKTGNAEGCG